MDSKICSPALRGASARKPFWIGNLIMFAILLAVVIPVAVIMALRGSDLRRAARLS